MSYDTDEFYTIDGMKVTRPYLVQKMIDYYNEKYPNTQITDFNEGSEIRNLLESISADIFHKEYHENLQLKEAFLTTADGNFLDLHGEEYKIKREEATQAQGTVTFTIPDTLPYVLTIPQYTRLVETSTGLFYETWLTVEIPIGETSVDCPVYSVMIGEKTNIPAECEWIFYEDNMFKDVRISNSQPFTDGKDAEKDDDYRKRILEAKTSDGFGSREYYTKLGKIKGIHDIAISPSQRVDITAQIIVNGYEKPISDELLAKVTSLYTNEKKIVYNHVFEVKKATFTTVPLKIDIGVTDLIPDNTIVKILNNYFDGGILNINNQQFNHKGCSVNSIISNYELMTLIESINGVVQVTDLTSPGNTFPLTPVINKVLKLGSVTINQEVV